MIYCQLKPLEVFHKGGLKVGLRMSTTLSIRFYLFIFKTNKKSLVKEIELNSTSDVWVNKYCAPTISSSIFLMWIYIVYSVPHIYHTQCSWGEVQPLLRLWLIEYHFKLPTSMKMLEHDLEFSTNGMQVISSCYEVEDPVPSTTFFPQKWEAQYFNSTNAYILGMAKLRIPLPPKNFGHTRLNLQCSMFNQLHVVIFWFPLQPTHTYQCGLPANNSYQQGPLLGVFQPVRTIGRNQCCTGML